MMKNTPAKTMAGSNMRRPLPHYFKMLEQIRRKLRSRRNEALAALRAHAGGAETARHPALLIEAGALEHEDVLQRDHVAFHSRDLGHLRDVALAVGLTGNLNDQVDGRSDLITDLSLIH